MNNSITSVQHQASSARGWALIVAFVSVLAPATGVMLSLAVAAWSLPHYIEHGDLFSWLSFGGACGAGTVCSSYLQFSLRSPRKAATDEPHAPRVMS